jgi:hypothetical protein
MNYGCLVTRFVATDHASATEPLGAFAEDTAKRAPAEADALSGAHLKVRDQAAVDRI